MSEQNRKEKLKGRVRAVDGFVEEKIEDLAEGVAAIADGLDDAADKVDQRVGVVKAGIREDISEIKDDLVEVRDEFRDDVDRASAAVRRLEDSCAEAAEQNKSFPKVMKVFGALLIFAGLVHLVGYAIIITLAALVMHKGGISSLSAIADLQTALSVSFSVVLFVLVVASSVVSVMLGMRLLGNRRTRAAHYAKVLMLVEFASLLFSVMLYGFSSAAFVSLAYAIFLGLLSVYADPTLRRERLAKRKAQQLEDKEDQEAGVLGLDKSGKGYIELNFFNMFWIFVVCCVLGLIVEDVYHMTVIDPGVYQDRAGLLYGPFSPIYGVGGVLITIALNRFYKKNLAVVFLAAATIGAFFEFMVSWWMEMSFGITAWDYSGTFLNIDGRTNFKFFCMWGCLGIFWLRLILPRLLVLINRIPWNWRYSLTAFCSVLMFVNCALTVAALDRWYERQVVSDAAVSESALEVFCDRHYDDQYMANRFQTMSIDVDASTRVS